MDCSRRSKHLNKVLTVFAISMYLPHLIVSSRLMPPSLISDPFAVSISSTIFSNSRPSGNIVFDSQPGVDISSTHTWKDVSTYLSHKILPFSNASYHCAVAFRNRSTSRTFMPSRQFVFRPMRCASMSGAMQFATRLKLR